MTTKPTLSIKALTPSTGAIVSGVALQDIDEPAAQAIRQALFEHGVLVFRDQFLQPQDQLRAARMFGEVMVHEGLDLPGDLPPGITLLANDGHMPGVTENWHSDGVYLAEPASVCLLSPQVLPPSGGDTMWANQYLAYERLSDGMKQLLKGLQCVCESTRITNAYQLKETLRAVQPAVRRHPATGRPSLYIGNPDAFVRFTHMTREESLPIIRYLYEQACQPDLVYRHMWRPGDLVVWDNRCTLHYAVHDYGTAQRDMHRVALRGEPAVLY